MDFCHLHLHTEYSMLDGYGKAKEYAQKAKELGYKYLAITDHGNIDGFIDFQKNCLENDITPIFGCEVYIVENMSSKQSRKHITFWIKNNVGFKNLCSLLSIANLDNFYRKPIITFDNLRKHYKGLVIGTACLNSFINLPNGEEFFRELKNLVKEDLYLELMLNTLPEQKQHNDKIFKLAKETKTKIIFTHDCHYVNKSEAIYQEIMLAIQRKAKWNDPNRWRFDLDSLYLLSKKEVKDLLLANELNLSYAENTFEVVEKCKNFKIKKREIILPKLRNVKDEAKFLKHLCEDKFNTIPEWNWSYLERFEYEYDLIIRKKFERYILIVWDLCRWARDNDILIGPGRGSVGGSLIAYLLGITSIDPIKHNLLFERFIAQDRIDYPDIDLDFDKEKIHLIRKHLEDIYGVENIASVSNFNTFKARGSVQDIARVFNVNYLEVNEFTKTFVNDPSLSEEEILELSLKSHEGQIFNQEYPDIIEHAKHITGRIRNYSQHAAAIVISTKPFDKAGRCNLIRGKNTRINWDKNDAEHVGYIKLDILSLRLLSVISSTLSQIKANYNKYINLNNINFNDSNVLRRIDSNHNEGVFQLDTYSMKELINEMTIDSFDTITHLVALVRPGPKNSGMTEKYIERQRTNRWKKMHPVYEKLTEDTFGLLLFQEQIMAVINEVAGLPYSTADKIRKIISKKRDKGKFREYEKLFKRGCRKVNIFSKQQANEFWDGLLSWAQYGFNKSHSVGYATTSYWCAYLKYYYPAEFISASLTFGADSKKQNLLNESFENQVIMVTPKVGISHATKWIAKNNKLFVPFSEVKGLGKKKALLAAENPNKEKQNGLLKFVTMKNVKVEHSGALGNLLRKIKAYDLEDERITTEMRDFFDFDLY